MEATERDGRVLASATEPVGQVDPGAFAFASRRASDRFFCWEQPDRNFALAGLGSAHEAVSRGPKRFGDVAEDCAALMRDRVASEPEGLPGGAGPVWAGGFAFDPDGGGASHWASFPPALMVLPEVSIVRSGEGRFLTVNVVVSGNGEQALDRARTRVESLVDEPLPMLDPHPAERARISSARAPGEFEQAVTIARSRIAAGDLEKVVLAREVVVEAAEAHNVAAIYGAIREAFPSCFCFCVGTPEGAFIGASPELLVRRSGAVAATVSLAGSTRRSADPAVDDHLGEQLLRSDKDRQEHAIVAKRIERLLRPLSVWVEAEREPSLVRILNIQHLATPVHAQLAEPQSALALVEALHPTPAVGGEPRAKALELLAKLEGMDRGWYAGPVGWMDATEDGEFCVALRSALLRDREARLFAGGGIVADSEPEAELAETEVKLEALLPLVAG